MDHLSYDPSSERMQGTPSITRGSPRPIPNGTKTIINPNPVPVREPDESDDDFADRLEAAIFATELSHTDRLAQRKQTSLQLSSTFTSTTEAEGSYGGVSLKQTIELSVGIEAGNEHEETHEQEDTANLPDIKIPAGQALFQTVTKETVTVQTPFTLRAYPDFGEIVLDFHDHSGEGRMGRYRSQRILRDNGRWGRGKSVSVNGFTGLLRFMNGGDWRYREMIAYRGMLREQARRGERNSRLALDAIRWLENKRNRRIEVDGVEIDVFDDNLTIHPRFGKVV